MSFTPRASKESADAATIPPITTKRATGLCLRKTFPMMRNASAIPPTRSEIEFVSPRCLKKKPYAALESGHDALRNEIHHDSGLREPRNEGDERDEQRCAGRERAKAHRITARHFAERRADDQRDGGSNRNRSVPRTAKGPEDQATKQASVKTSFRRQIGKRRVAQSRGKQICGKRNAGENIASEPTSIITA